MIYQRTKGLTGMEGITAIGWPMHGATRSDRRNNMFNEIVGHSNAPPAAASNLRFRTDHYPVVIPNLSGDWAHFMMHENEYEVNDPITGKVFSIGAVPAVYSGTRSESVIMGIPIMTPSGKSIRVCVTKEVDSHTLRVFDANGYQEKLIPYVFNTEGLKSKYPVRPFGFSGFDDYFMIDISTMSDPEKWQRPAFISRVLDYFKNKILVAIEVRGFGINYSDIPSYEVLNKTDRQMYFRSETAGSSAMLAVEAGQNIVAVIELTLGGETIDDVTATVVYSPSDVEGTVSRVSPTEVTLSVIELSAIEWMTRQSYSWSVMQVGAILDAYYDGLGNVSARRYTVEHTFNGNRDKTNGDYWSCKFETQSVVSLDGVARQYRQVIEHVIDEPDDLDGPPSDYPNVIVTNTIYVDYNLFSTETISSRDYDMIIRPPEFSAISGQRAPYAGAEARCAQYGIGYAYASQKDYYNPSVYTLIIRKNNSGTCAMFGVVENFWYWPDYPNTKRVSATTVRSKAGNMTIAAFNDVVTHMDPRYSSPSDTNHAVRRGYVGAKLKASVNLVTGEYYQEILDSPMLSINWR